MDLFKKSEGQSLLPNRLVRELGKITNAATIKAILYFYLRVNGSSLSLNQLLSDRAFVSLFHSTAEAKKALAEAVLGKLILALPVEGDTFYFAASEEGYENYQKTSASRPEILPTATVVPTPNIYVLYEENVGILSPLIAQELGNLEEQYPMGWIYEAFKEAALQNKKRSFHCAAKYTG